MEQVVLCTLLFLSRRTLRNYKLERFLALLYYKLRRLDSNKMWPDLQNCSTGGLGKVILSQNICQMKTAWLGSGNHVQIYVCLPNGKRILQPFLNNPYSMEVVLAILKNANTT